MLDLDGGDPEPETAQLDSKQLEEFRGEAARFRQQRRASAGKKKNGHIVVLLIALVLLGAFILAILWALVLPYSVRRPRPSSVGPLAGTRALAAPRAGVPGCSAGPFDGSGLSPCELTGTGNR